MLQVFPENMDRGPGAYCSDLQGLVSVACVRESYDFK